MELVEVFHWKYRLSQNMNELEWRLYMTHPNTKHSVTGETRDVNGHKNQERAC